MALPRLYEHGAPTARATILLHGLTNCPQQFDELARLLHERGENVYVPRLPHHGHRDRLTPAVGRLTVGEIDAAAGEADRLGAALGAEVNVLGISLGATIALWLAQRAPVARAIAVAPFLMLPWLPRPAGMLVVHALDALPNRFLWWDPRIKEAMRPPYAYPGFWTHALAQSVLAGAPLFRHARRTRPRAASATIVTNAQDPAVGNGAARELARAWGRHGEAYRLETWDDLGKVHDVIDPSTYARARELVYPRLIARLTS